MGRKKIDPKTKAERVAIVIKGMKPWKIWLEGAADYNRMDLPTLFDVAVTKYVRDTGYLEAPPPRVARPKTSPTLQDADTSNSED